MLTHDELAAEVVRLRVALSSAAEMLHPLRAVSSAVASGDAREVIERALAIDPTCSLCRAGHVPARPCGPVESAARSVAPWCADHVRESEELRSPPSVCACSLSFAECDATGCRSDA